MPTTTVKQPRVIDFYPGLDKGFADYVSKNHLNLEHRAYIMHLGSNMISHVNENFVRLSIPYKRAASNYGVVILPKEQVIVSNAVTDFDKKPMYDVDLGDKAGKLTVSYIDENGEKCQRLESTRYIERYLNFTQSAYRDGNYYLSDLSNVLYDYKSDFPSCANDAEFCEIYEFMHNMYAFKNVSTSRSSANCHKDAVVNGFRYFEQFETSDGFDYHRCDEKYQEMCQRMKDCLLSKLKYTAEFFCPKLDEERNRVGSSLNANAAYMYLNAYLDGLIEQSRKDIYATMCSFYPPSKKDNPKVYDLARRFSQNNLENNHTHLIEARTEVSNRSQSNNNVQAVEYEDDFLLPF